MDIPIIFYCSHLRRNKKRTPPLHKGGIKAAKDKRLKMPPFGLVKKEGRLVQYESTY